MTFFRRVLKGSFMVIYLFCSLPCRGTLAKTSRIIPFGLGLYSGIFAIYLQCQSDKSTGRTSTIIFYAICLLYVLSTVNFVSDLAAFILNVSNNSICSKIIIFYHLCSRLPIHCFPLKLSKPHHPVVVISSPNLS